MELGRDLFFDGRLSSNGEVPCASCHQPGHGFSDSRPFSVGVNGKLSGRHAPTLINRAWGKSEFWDGRAPDLEAQVIIPITNPNEMNMTAEQVVTVIRSIAGYAPLFASAYGDPNITFDRVSKALANFVRTIVSGNSAYDRYMAGDKSALTKEQKRGMEFFNGKGECAECHDGANFTNEKFANLGIGFDKPNPDPGREDVTHKKGDMGKFKTPTLRDAASLPLYMHDGRFLTLDQVVDFYAQGGIPNPHVDTRLLKFFIDKQIREELVAFLNSLSGEGWQTIRRPERLPQ